MARLTHFRAAVLLVTVLAIGAIAVSLLATPLWWKGAAANVIGLAGFIGVAYGIRLHRPAGIVWRVLMAGAALNAVALAYWWWPVLVGGDAPLGMPTLADVGWLASFALVAAGVVIALTRREPTLVVALDVLALAVGAGLLIAVFLIAPAVSGSATPADVLVTQLAYIAIGILVLAVAVRLLLAPRPRAGAATLLALSALAVVFSTLIWNALTLSGSYLPGAWADLGWQMSPLLLALAALHPSMRRIAEHRPEREVELRPLGAVLLGVALLVVPALFGISAVAEIAPELHHVRWMAIVATLAGVLLAGLVVARMHLLLRRGRELAGALSAALDERGRELVLSEARHRRLVERLPGVVYELELDDSGAPGRVLYASPQTAGLLGVSPEECLRSGLLANVHPDDRAAATGALGSAGGDERGESAEFRCARSDGAEVWLRAKSTALRRADGSRVIQGFLFDISEARQAQAERDRMELDLRLAQKLEAVGQLAAGIAHEINTPVQFVGDTIRFLEEAFEDLLRLTSVYGELHAAASERAVSPRLLERTREAEQLADLEYLEERVPAALERGVDGVQRVARIVAAMRDFAHPPTTERVPVDLNRAIGTTLVVANNAYKYVADVETDLDDLPPVVCNLGDMNQVFLNLIVNAAQAVEETGERGTIAVRTRVDGDDVVVSVSDTGGGIPADVAARIYDPFYTTKAVGRGTGQGLAIARAIVVERHEGEISFDTVVGRGTTFHVRLPLAPDVADPPPARTGSEATAGVPA